MLAREQVETWLPPDNMHCLEGTRQVFHDEAKMPTWKKHDDEQSPGCSYCGSMSVEELLETIDAGNIVEMSDKGYKAYVRRYKHPGPCSYPYHEENEQGGSVTSHGCGCDPRGKGGGPIKFYLWHLLDGGRDAVFHDRLALRLRVLSAESYRRLVETMQDRSKSIEERVKSHYGKD